MMVVDVPVEDLSDEELIAFVEEARNRPQKLSFNVINLNPNRVRMPEVVFDVPVGFQVLSVLNDDAHPGHINVLMVKQHPQEQDEQAELAFTEIISRGLAMLKANGELVVTEGDGEAADDEDEGDEGEESNGEDE